MQIEHSVVRVDDVKVSEEHIKLKKAVVSVLFQESDIAPAGDSFISRLGIDSRRKLADGSFSTVAVGEEVTFNAE